MIMDMIFEVLVFLFATAAAIFASGMLIAATLVFLEWLTKDRSKE